MDLSLNGQTIRNVDLVIFHKDGTITDLYTYWSYLARIRAELLCEEANLSTFYYADEIMEVMGLDVKNARFRPEGPTGIKVRSEVISVVADYMNMIGVRDPREMCESVFAEADRRAADELPKLIKVLPGVREFFTALDKRCKTAIVTSDSHTRAINAMKQTGLNVDLIIGSDEVKAPKPDPEIVNVALRKLGIPGERAVIIGDTTSDLLCGKRAGLQASIGVATGPVPKANLVESTPYVVDSLSEVKVFA